VQAGLAMLALLAVLFDTREIRGINPWIKPLQFDVSVLILLLTMVALSSSLSRFLALGVRVEIAEVVEVAGDKSRTEVTVALTDQLNPILADARLQPPFGTSCTFPMDTQPPPPSRYRSKSLWTCRRLIAGTAAAKHAVRRPARTSVGTSILLRSTSCIVTRPISNRNF
jgi:hypothetical protein